MTKHEVSKQEEYNYCIIADDPSFTITTEPNPQQETTVLYFKKNKSNNNDIKIKHRNLKSI